MQHLNDNWLGKIGRSVVLTVALGLGACATTVKYGAPPLIDNVGVLTIGESNRSDVIVALGEPRGSGATRFGELRDPRDIWFYEYLESDGKQVQLDMLLVFMLPDAYDGYLWFSSFEKVEVEGGGLLSVPDSFTQGFFPDVSELDDRLIRGSSEEQNVIALLGAPTGFGRAVLPPNHRTHDVYYYEQVEIEDMDMSGGMSNIAMDMQQRILLVFLLDGVYDGFMWYGNAGLAEAQID